MPTKKPKDLTIEKEDEIFDCYINGNIDKKELKVRLGLSDEAVDDYIKVRTGVEKRENDKSFDLL